MNKEEKIKLVKNAYEGTIERAEYNRIDVIAVSLDIFDDEVEYIEDTVELNKMLQEEFEKNGYAIYIDLYPCDGIIKNCPPEHFMAVK